MSVPWPQIYTSGQRVQNVQKIRSLPPNRALKLKFYFCERKLVNYLIYAKNVQKDYVMQKDLENYIQNTLRNAIVPSWDYLIELNGKKTLTEIN